MRFNAQRTAILLIVSTEIISVGGVQDTKLQEWLESLREDLCNRGAIGRLNRLEVL
jgi:hypothetical protein